jgi:DNA-binding HxlR family transcriptional regulator
LNELDQRKVVERKVYPETPPRVEYALTKKGMELSVILGSLADWVMKWDKTSNSAARANDEKVRAAVRSK